MQSLTSVQHRLLAGFAAGAALVAALHLGTVFFYVAPANPVSKEYRQQIDSWIYPYFEQHWALFAPNPFTENYVLSVRTASDRRAGPWVDLSAVDSEAMRHSVYPARANQNMLRRAWKIYRGGDDLHAPARTDRAELFRNYLRNIAAGRLAELGHGEYELMQLRITTRAIAPPDSAAAPRPRQQLLPWWKAPA